MKRCTKAGFLGGWGELRGDEGLEDSQCERWSYKWRTPQAPFLGEQLAKWPVIAGHRALLAPVGVLLEPVRVRQRSTVDFWGGEGAPDRRGWSLLEATPMIGSRLGGFVCECLLLKGKQWDLFFRFVFLSD